MTYSELFTHISKYHATILYHSLHITSLPDVNMMYICYYSLLRYLILFEEDKRQITPL